MSTTAETSAVATSTSLRGLYLARFGFAVVWAVLIFAVGKDLDPVTGALLVLYPLVDVAAAVVDFRTTTTARPTVGLSVNMALSLLAAVGLAVAVTSGVPAVLRVWGAWAITAGVVQLVVAISRHRIGGQWAQILSGAISTLAGAGFILMAGGSNGMLASLGGYATLGGIFFLISALRLRPAATKES